MGLGCVWKPSERGYGCCHLGHERELYFTSSYLASKARAKAKVSISEDGLEKSNSRRMLGFKPVMKKLIKRGSEIPVTLFIKSSKADWKSATVVV